jgi:hypothetical protein
MRIQSRVAGKTLPKDTDKMVYGVDMSAPSATLAPTQPGPEPAAAASPTPPGIDPWASDDPWLCPPCPPEAQSADGQWHLGPFGKGGKKGERPPMACYNCLGLGHPKALCASAYGAGEQKLMPKCKNCGGHGHDTPACTSRGGGKYSPPQGNGKRQRQGQGLWRRQRHRRLPMGQRSLGKRQRQGVGI